VIRHLRRVFRYDGWANRETLRSLDKSAPPRSLKWLAHIIGAEYLWMARLRRRPETIPVWPELDVDACGERLDELSRLWPEYLDDAARSLAEMIPYTNSKGETWTNTVEEILTHVVIHSAYHRGQIASDVRATGGTPAYTDYIHAVRQGLIE
jgi:uncharacterized damage-inducible protein DinB